MVFFRFCPYAFHLCVKGIQVNTVIKKFLQLTNNQFCTSNATVKRNLSHINTAMQIQQNKNKIECKSTPALEIAFTMDYTSKVSCKSFVSTNL